MTLGFPPRGALAALVVGALAGTPLACRDAGGLGPLSEPRFPGMDDDDGAGGPDDDDSAGGADDDDTGGGDDDDVGDDDAGDDDAGDDDAGDDDAGDDDVAGPCADGMALVSPAGAPDVCVDRFEAALQVQSGAAWVPRAPYGPLEPSEVVRAVPADGLVPQGYIAGDEAAAACAASGKRLCSSAEWLAACRGPASSVYPYGDAHAAGVCNDAYPGTHPVVDYFGTNRGVWTSAAMNDPGINQQPDTVDPGGANPGCVSAWGVYDLHGNLHEWIDDAAGTFRGGFFADAALNGPGCTYVTTAHAVTYHDYSTGFRCCVAPTQ